MIQLRERVWEGLPPPPELKTRKPNPITKDQEDPSATPIATSLGLPKGDPQSNLLHPSPLESITTLETDTVPASPITQSPSISVSSLSDFAIADTSDDESPTDPTTPSTSRTGTLKCYAGTHCSVFTLASYPFTLLHFAGCSPKLAWHRQNHQTVVLVSCPRTLPGISPRFSR